MNRSFHNRDDRHGVRRRRRTKPGTHVPVMVREVMASLRPRKGEIVVDCTVGFGGHAARLCRRIGPEGRLIGLDVDGEQLRRTRERLAATGAGVSLHHASYTRLPDILSDSGLDSCDVIFADLGVSSMQIDDPQRGVSYRHADAPLDMRMNRRDGKTASEILATISAGDLSAALADLADEPDHEKIAAWIVQQREVSPLTTTSQLVRLVFDAKGLSKKTWKNHASTRYGELHPAARTFQAIRILTNNELANLSRLLELCPQILRPGGRIGIISFHSGEDRLVKNAFRDGVKSGLYYRISSKALTPRASEVGDNPRSGSAKFRWALTPTD